MGLLHYFLGIEVYQDKEEVFISQKMYVEKILNVWLKTNGLLPVLSMKN
jgi:hypothetical protein